MFGELHLPRNLRLGHSIWTQYVNNKKYKFGESPNQKGEGAELGGAQGLRERLGTGTGTRTSTGTGNFWSQ